MSALTNTFADIADAIRAKTGGSETIKPVDMATAIAAIPSGGGLNYNYYTGTITSNPQTFNFSEDAKYIIGFVQNPSQSNTQSGFYIDIENEKNCGVGPYNTMDTIHLADGLVYKELNGMINRAIGAKNSLTLAGLTNSVTYGFIVLY